MVAGGLLQLQNNFLGASHGPENEKKESIGDSSPRSSGENESKWGVVCVGVGDCKVFKLSFPTKGIYLASPSFHPLSPFASYAFLFFSTENFKCD